MAPGAGGSRSPDGSAKRRLRTAAEVDVEVGVVGAGGSSVRVVFLGGLGEIGRNCACIEVDGRILVLDVGIMFPDPDMPGVDLVLPDFTYLRENADRVDGVILTHGHEDHTGGLAYLLRDFPVDVYGSELTLSLARSRVDEAGMASRATFIPVRDHERRRIGPCDVEFIPVTHSVPHAFATAFHTPQGIILHSGDFKIDLHPVDGRRTDLARMGALASDPGIRLLLADSTNAEEPGFTASESTVGATLEKVFLARPDRRFIVTCFASHIHRVQQVADAAIAGGRVVATLGRSMQKNVALARKLDLLHIPDSALVDIEDVDDYPPGRVCVISTGSQGEPMSALSRLATGENRFFKLHEDDVVVISAHPIPGNEWSVGRVIDSLHRLGVEVIHSGVENVHVSGHARQGELAMLMTVTQPEFFIPVHGEYRHMANHVRLAASMGIAGDRVLLCEDGDAVRLDDAGMRRDGTVPGRLPVRRRQLGRRHRPRRAAGPDGPRRGGRGHGRRHRRPEAGRGDRRAPDRHPGLGLRPGHRCAARRGPDPGDPGPRAGAVLGELRPRDPQPGGPQGARQAGGRAHPPAPDDRPGHRHRLTVGGPDAVRPAVGSARGSGRPARRADRWCPPDRRIAAVAWYPL